jgi:hypothetical protein
MSTRIDVTLEDLYHLRGRIDRQQLAPQDWAVVGRPGVDTHRAH